jgi:hypothetical protein
LFVQPALAGRAGSDRPDSMIFRDIQDDALRILVIDIGNRREVYR